MQPNDEIKGAEISTPPQLQHVGRIINPPFSRKAAGCDFGRPALHPRSTISVSARLLRLRCGVSRRRVSDERGRVRSQYVRASLKEILRVALA